MFHPNEDTDTNTVTVNVEKNEDMCSLVDGIEVFQIHKLLSNCKNKAMGSDGIPTKLYEKASLIISEPLTHIIKCSLLECTMPNIWKVSHIAPIPKTSPPTADQLRPISLLPLPSKILERIILYHFRDQLTQLFGNNQFAYRAKSSTTAALIALHDHITQLLDCSDTAAAVLLSLDFSKAFDCISHKILIDTLQQCNLNHNFVSFISSYLAGRTQAVKYGGNISELIPVTSGVPQGSVLGPFLFCIYVHSLQVNNDTTKLLKYADDTQCIFQIRKSNFRNDLQTVKSSLGSIKSWSLEKKLILNNNKTKAIIFPKSKSQTVSIADIDETIKVVDCMKILGVIVNNRLSWDSHIDNVIKTCSQRFHLLRQLKPFLDGKQLTDVYNGIIRSKMEYCSSLFIDLNVTEKQKLNRLQKRYHRLKCGNNCSNECLEDLDKRRVKLATNLWCDMSNNEHILHALKPPILQRTGHYQVAFCNTNRRRGAFAQSMPIILNADM